MISRERIEEAKKKLGDSAFRIMADEIPLECVDLNKGVCKSPFKDEKTASAHWFKDANCIHCFATGLNMDYIDYLMKYRGASFMGAVKELFILIGEDFKEEDFKDTTNNDYFKNFKFSKDENDDDRQVVNKYLNLRGISEQTLDYCDVKQNDNCDIAFQFYDLNNELIQTKYRVSHPAKNGEKKWYWQSGADTCAMLYGVNKINYDIPLVITEGFNDRLAVVESGYQNCVSIPGGASDLNWIDFNFEILERCKEIILWYDDDEAGKSHVKECANRIGIYKTKIVQSDDEVKCKIKDFYSKSGNNIDKIDANNVLVVCGKDSVLKFISDAKEIENPLVQHLMDVEEVQLQDMKRISTGFASMDKVFYGNFTNSLTILTGKSGNGKSSILNTMFVASPLEAGEKVFIYSGEIPSGILLGNIIKPLASQRHILEFKNEGQPNGYAVSREAAKEIKKYYRDSLFNYNDTNQFDTNSKSIIQSMEYSYRRYGVQNFIIDSLLTVDCSKEDGEDKYEKQKNFVINLKNFTNRNPVRVALVAHSRKLPAGTKEIGGDDIAGSSDILKCCNRAYSVEILWDDPNGYNTLVRCIKDRETGLIDKEIKLYYDKKSYRIYSNSQELERAYGWEGNCKINYNEKLKWQLVCNKKYDKETEEVIGVIKQ